MNYWQHVQTAAGMGGYFHWVLLVLTASAFVLAAVAPQARPRLRAALLLIYLSAVGVLLCALLLHRGVFTETATGYRALHYFTYLFLAIGTTNLAGVLLFRVLLPPVGLQPAPILRDTLLGLAYVAAALVLLGRHGVNLSGVVATSAVVTAIIGFSLQDTLGNVMGGMALQMERSIGVGDWIRLGDVEGVVREIRWRQTSIETRNGDAVIIPNSQLMKSQVTVWGRREGQGYTPARLHRMWVTFNVDFRHAPADVIEAVERALRGESIPNVATDPAPDCILQDFKDSYGTYAVRYWLSDFARNDPTSSEVRTRVFVALQRAGIGLSIPAQSVFMTLEGRSRTERKQREEVGRRVSVLKRVRILEPLTEQERAEVAERLTVAPFRRGEIITRQGSEAHHLYMITKGEVEVRIGGDNGHGRRVATLRTGDVFGEMALLTGEPRTATVKALTDVVCYRLTKEGFQDVLQRRPEIADSISHLLAARKLGLDAVGDELAAETVSQRMQDTRGDLLTRMRKFFTLQ